MGRRRKKVNKKKCCKKKTGRTRSKVIHPKYYLKTLERRCSEQPFGQIKKGLVSGR
jgi:hypothetical protein